AKHGVHFDALKIDFAKAGYNIDKSCRDVSRLRGMSYDAEAKENLNAIPYKRIYTPKKRILKRSYTDKALDIAGLETWLNNKGETYVDGNRHTYLFKLISACSRLDISKASIEQHIDCHYNLSPNEVTGILKSVYR
ncbi:unnamed protein product, partial [marine sediment metagenome]